MQYIKSEHYIIDYRTNTREHVGTYFATRELALEQNKIFVSGSVKGTPYRFVTVLEGPELLEFKNYMEGNETPVSTGRFLNSEYEEMIIEADMPDKNISIEGVSTKVSDVLQVSTKTVKDKTTGKVTAIVQEIINFITKEDFERAIRTAP